MATEAKVNVFLDECEPSRGSNRFVVGAFHAGITLYNQQVRALNLIHALHETKRIKMGARIGIIGGGVSGLTTFAAAQVLGYHAWLFETNPVLIHLQGGCDTRWVHPHVYEWPKEGTELPYAGLPFMDWQEATAGDVARQLVREFSKYQNDERIYRGATLVVENKSVQWNNSIHTTERQGQREFEAIIFAVGFGTERLTNENMKRSYWRNDSINQPDPGAIHGEKKRIFITGTGDGGLTDVLRACIDGFHQARLIRELIPHDSTTLIKNLRDISKAWFEKPREPGTTWLYDSFRQLKDDGELNELFSNVKRRQRVDTIVMLNGRAARFAGIVRLDSASLLNNLLAYVLFTLNAFEYRAGDCTISNSTVRIGNIESTHDEVVIRHGTDREEVLRNAGCTEGVDRLQQLGPNLIRTKNPSERLWPAGWWGRTSNQLGNVGIEFVPPATQLVATTFVSTLSDILKLSHSKANPEFRITLHRVMQYGDEVVFQQVCRYAGSKVGGQVGRVFPIDKGLVGYVCRSGRPAIVAKKADFDATLERLDVEALHSMPLSSVLACPFFASRSSTSERFVTLVLFIDSAQPNFFEGKKGKIVLNTVYGACRGFVTNVEEMKKNNELVFPVASYPGWRSTGEPDAELIAWAKDLESLSFEDSVFENFEQDLTFTTVDSFNADVWRYT